MARRGSSRDHKPARSPLSRGGHPLERPELSAEGVNLIPGYDAVRTAGDCRFDPAAASHAIEFIERACRFAKGSWAGQPFVLQPFQFVIVANLYGWLRPDGTRRYRDSRWWMPRKAGKTELGAALSLYRMVLAVDKRVDS